MRSIVVVGFIALVVGSLVLVAQAPQRGAAGGDSRTPVFWSAKQMADLGAQASTRVSADTHMAGVQLVASASLIYRTGDSGSEIHEKQADFIIVREGEGAIVVGGKMIGGKLSRPDEIRGDSIEGGTRYPVAAGDTIYIPANMPHQFFVEKGKHWVINIVKITPQP
ncbi:MAG TPA: cupin domain-containing protein [Terriglobia bacterium]|nr:cupin domain-containing protein [Terriglobia bacterium]